MHPLYKIKQRQNEAASRARQTEKVSRRKRRVLILTQLGLIAGASLWVVLGLKTGDWGNGGFAAVPGLTVSGLMLDLLRML